VNRTVQPDRFKIKA